MTIEEQLIAAQTAAMKDGDRATLSAIRQVRSEVGLAKSAPGFTGKVDDELFIATISTYVKRMAKSKAEYETLGDRGVEQAEKLAFEPKTPEQEAWCELLAIYQESGQQDKLKKHAKRISLSWSTMKQMKAYMEAIENHYQAIDENGNFINGGPLPIIDHFAGKQ